ncbi:MAG: hypothetical protein ACM3PS_01105 [Syntrophothermus sp.]
MAIALEKDDFLQLRLASLHFPHRLQYPANNRHPTFSTKHIRFARSSLSDTDKPELEMVLLPFLIFLLTLAVVRGGWGE